MYKTENLEAVKGANSPRICMTCMHFVTNLEYIIALLNEVVNINLIFIIDQLVLTGSLFSFIAP